MARRYSSNPHRSSVAPTLFAFYTTAAAHLILSCVQRCNFVHTPTLGRLLRQGLFEIAQLNATRYQEGVGHNGAVPCACPDSSFTPTSKGRHKALPLRIKLRAKPFPKRVQGRTPTGVWGVPKYLFSSFLLFRRRLNRRVEGIFLVLAALKRVT